MFNSRAVAILRLSSSSSLSPWKRRQLPCNRCPSSASSSFSSSVSGRRSSSSDDDRRISLAAAACDAAAAAAADVAPFPVTSSPDFYNTRVIYGTRSSWEIVRSYFVFSLCSFDFIVDRQAKILSLVRRLLGRPLFVQLIKRTIFGQFMSTDDPDVILDLARRHSQSTVSPLFAYTAAEFHGHQTGGLPGESAQNKSARDVWCQRNFDAILQGIATASRCKEFTLDKPVVTTKITFLTDYAVLRQLTEAINRQTRLIESAMIDSCQMKDPLRHRSLIEYLTTDVLQRKPTIDLSQLAPPGMSKSSADDHQLQMFGLLTSVRFHLAFNQSLHEAPSSASTKIMNDSKLPVIKLSRDDIGRIVDVWASMNKLNERASEADVFINYDAEQTFIQPAIEALVLDSMRIFNRQRPLVLNTYQCYLKRTFDIVKRDLEICDLEGFCFGGKVVRGAYMDEERRLARETNLADPVNDNYEATTESYIRVLDHLLSRSAADIYKDILQPLQPQTLSRRQQQQQQQRIIVATHNLDTVNFVIKQLAERKLDARKIGLSFAQLLGTRDYISFALGAAGYPAGKLIHYADPEDGLAYLSRRVQENRSGLPSPAIERRLLRMELKRRIFRR